MSVKLVTAPCDPPLSVSECKSLMDVEHSDHDARIGLLIQSETAYAEDFMGRAIMPQTWDYFQDAFPAECATPQFIRLPLPKVISITGVYYQDSDGTEQTLDVDAYVADINSEPARIGLAVNGTWPTTYDGLGAVRVRFRTGYADEDSDVLANIKIAIWMRVQALYQAGDQASDLMARAETILRRYRVHLALA